MKAAAVEEDDSEEESEEEDSDDEEDEAPKQVRSFVFTLEGLQTRAYQLSMKYHQQHCTWVRLRLLLRQRTPTVDGVTSLKRGLSRLRRRSRPPSPQARAHQLLL